MTSKGKKWEAGIRNQGLKNLERWPTFEILCWLRRSRMPRVEQKHGRMT
jgi:hypothetical protein